MPRAHDDHWDLASSVGAAATMVAAGRAVATKDPRGLINDPFAEPLVRAVGLDFFTKMMDGELDMTAVENFSPVRAQAMFDGMAVRTKYFDDYFVNAVRAGVRQVQGMPNLFREHGVDIDLASLVYTGERNHVLDYLTTKGWNVEGVTRAKLFVRNGLDVPAPQDDDPLGEIIFISGGLTG